MRFLVAAIQVDAAGAIVGKSFGFVRNPAAPAASVYSFTLDPKIDTNNAVPIATITGALSGVASAGPIGGGDATLPVSTFNGAGAPTNRGFHLLVFTRANKGASLIGDGGIGRLHSSVEVTTIEVDGAYIGRRLRVVGTGAVVVANVYDITLAEQISALDAAVLVSPVAAAAPMGLVSVSSISVVASRTHVFVATFAQGAGPSPAARAFNLDVWRKGI